MPQFYRISVVKMVHAKYPAKATPEPFSEIRSYVFLKTLPTGVRLSNLRRSLESSLKEIMDKLLPHIYKGKMGDYTFDTQEPKAAISVKTLTKFFKIEIDGFEVEPVDIDEVLVEKLFWTIKGYRIPFDHHLFTERRIEDVATGRKKLSLRTLRVYRYMAFYDEDGNIKGEYDEGDISEMLKKVYLVERRLRLVKQMYSQATGLLERTTRELEAAVSDLEKLLKRFKV
jgi:hypothetical protein